MSSGCHSHLLQTVTNLAVEYQPATLHVTLCVNFLSIHVTLQHACRFMHALTLLYHEETEIEPS